jgi:hypothetical protein
VIDNAQVSSNELVLQIGSIRNHNLRSLVGDENTGSSESDSLSDPDITRDGQVVELEDVWDRLESLLEVLIISSESCP